MSLIISIFINYFFIYQLTFIFQNPILLIYRVVLHQELRRQGTTLSYVRMVSWGFYGEVICLHSGAGFLVGRQSGLIVLALDRDPKDRCLFR